MCYKFLIRVIIILLAISLNVGCSVKTEIPPRPSNVPNNAIWVGGPDGGVYVLIRKHDDVSNKLYSAKIFYVSGDIAYNGLMKLYPEKSINFDDKKRESFVGWDGDKLYLTNNQYLIVQE